MIKMNSAALEKIISIYDQNHLSEELISIIEGGILYRDGVYIFAEFQESLSGVRNRIPDETGAEALINKIHVNDYASTDPNKVAFAFAFEIKRILTDKFRAEKFIIAIGIDDEDVIVSFHADREGQAWLSENIDTYKEGIVVIR